MTALLDLHDSSLRLWHEDTFLESPGYAWHDGNHFRFGLPAMHTQRRTPRDVNTRYWSQLSTQPLSPPPGAGSTWGRPCSRAFTGVTSARESTQISTHDRAG
jgi:hypothetical protein